MKSKRAREATEAEGKDPQVDVPAKKRKRGEDATEQGDESAGFVVDVKKSKKEDKKEKKDKKDKKDKKKDKESRREKKDKRKDLIDLPEEDPEEEVKASEPATEASEKTNGVDADEQKKLAKKEKKKQKKENKKNKEAAAPETNGATTNGTTTDTKQPPTADGDAIDLDDSAAGKADRHIVFVGNLPFTATAASISAHFASLSPIAVRCLRDRGEDAKPCRGIAFVEFGKVWHQRTCLDKFHHSEFNDGVSPPRKINVELTAGGGGKTKQRQQKIKDKNQKLDENRAKRIEKEKTGKDAGQGAAAKQQAASIEDSVHPSRRARVPGGF